MSLPSFKDWLAMQESSPSTRWRAESARGLKPPQADWNSRSTPAPWEEKAHRKQFKPAEDCGCEDCKKKEKKKKSKKKDQ